MHLILYPGRWKLDLPGSGFFLLGDRYKALAKGRMDFLCGGNKFLVYLSLCSPWRSGFDYGVCSAIYYVIVGVDRRDRNSNNYQHDSKEMLKYKYDFSCKLRIFKFTLTYYAKSFLIQPLTLQYTNGFFIFL